MSPETVTLLGLWQQSLRPCADNIDDVCRRTTLDDTMLARLGCQYLWLLNYSSTGDRPAIRTPYSDQGPGPRLELNSILLLVIISMLYYIYIRTSSIILTTRRAHCVSANCSSRCAGVRRAARVGATVPRNLRVDA